MSCDHRRHRKIVREQLRNGVQHGIPVIHWIACAECGEILMPWEKKQSLWPIELLPREIPAESQPETLSGPEWDYLE